MIIIMGSVKIEVSRVRDHMWGDGAQRTHEQNTLERAIREARLAQEVTAASYLSGLLR
ncbi:MAG TPA: hypothetical protein PLM74_05900 [Bacillota bacterium]|jgi:hypothetical protein|nr:hypothetical protein [Bacillota bacterium]